MAPLPQKAYSRAWKRFLRVFPFVLPLLYHAYYQLMTRWIGGAVLGDEKAHRRLSEACLRNLERNVPDPELRRRLTPDYQAACKRLVICSDFYPAISRPNAELANEPIDCVDAKGVVTADGRRHDLDVLVLATGLDPTAFVLPIRVTESHLSGGIAMRRDFVYWAFALAVGVALAVAFVDGARAYAQGPTWTPEQLLGDRNVRRDCDEKTKLCKVSEEDMRWIMARDTLLNRLLEMRRGR